MHAITVPTPLFLLPPNNNALEKKINQIKNKIESIIKKMLQTLVELNVVVDLGPFTVWYHFYILVIILKYY